MNNSKFSICFLDFKNIYKYNKSFARKDVAIKCANEILFNQSSNVIDFVGGTICIINNTSRCVIWSKPIN